MTTKGSEDADIQSFVVKPPGFDPAKKYPAVILIHGGPERRMGAKLELPLECAGFRVGRVRDGYAQSPRVRRLRPEIH